MFNGMNGLEILNSWPRFESGELVGFGDEYVNAKGNVSTLRTIVIKDCRDRLGGGYYWKLGKGACAVVVKNGERIKRPPVIAADGKPLESGQTVYVIENGKTHHVTEVDAVSKRFKSMEQIDGSPWLDPMCFTHKRPVLDADGVLTREGDEVWSTTGEFDGKRTVSSVHIDPDEPPYAMFEERQKPYSCLCCYLTHRAPVIAADGEPLEVGQTVYTFNDDRPYTVKKVETNRVSVNAGEGAYDVWRAPTYLTHQRPVLDADGVPIELGDDLYSVEGGLKLHVSNIDRVNYRIATSAMFALDKWADPSMFTHTKPEPDSWSSVWSDVSDGHETPEGMMRRCRALAERGE